MKFSSPGPREGALDAATLARGVSFDFLVEAPSAAAADAERERAAGFMNTHRDWAGVDGWKGALCRNKKSESGLHDDFGPDPPFLDWPTLRPRSADGRRKPAAAGPGEHPLCRGWVGGLFGTHKVIINIRTPELGPRIFV